MEGSKCGRRGGSVTRALALLLIVCLVECASGSCLSYGHSCWGAHGKRSGKPPSSAPDWFLTKLIRRMDSNDLSHRHEARGRNDDINAIFLDSVDDSQINDKGPDSDVVMEAAANRNPEAKPMLDEEMLAKIKFWQMMKEASEEK